jgi:hypothetical protein
MDRSRGDLGTWQELPHRLAVYGLGGKQRRGSGLSAGAAQVDDEFPDDGGGGLGVMVIGDQGERGSPGPTRR